MKLYKKAGAWYLLASGAVIHTGSLADCLVALASIRQTIASVKKACHG